MICKNCGQESGTGELCAACVASEGEAAAEQKPKLSRKKLILGIGVGVLGLGMIVGDIIVLPSAIRYMQAKNFTCGIEGDYEYDDFQLCDLGEVYGYPEHICVKWFKDKPVSVYDREIQDMPLFDKIELEFDSSYGLFGYDVMANYNCEGYQFDEGGKYDINVIYKYKEERLIVRILPSGDSQPLFIVSYTKE